MDRSKDWLEQGKSDLEAANHLLDTNDFSWSCFLAQQTAEKALKALGEYINIFLWGHDLVDLIEELEKKIKIPEKILDNSKTLNLYYISTRYPDAFTSGHPSEKFSKQQALDAIKLGKEILEYVQEKIK